MQWVDPTQKDLDMRSKNNFKIASSVVLLTAVSAIPISASAAGVEFSMSGQISRALTFADNGVDTDTLFVDNNNSGSRLRLKGQTELTPSLTAGVYWETQYQDNDSSAIDIGDSDNSSAFKSRIREVWFSGDWGKAYLGQGNGAANGTSEVDFSGTTIADYSGNNLDDGISFVGSNGLHGTTSPADVSVKNGSVFGNFDGLSRNDRLRYDLPSFGPLSIAVSTGQDRSELGIRYSGELSGGTKIGAAIGIVDNDESFEQIGLSASLLLASGLNITLHHGERDLDAGGVDPEGDYIKIGQIFGDSQQHHVSLGLHSVDDLAAIGDEAERTNLSYVYVFPKKGVEIFATWQNASLSRASGDLEDQDIFGIGSRIKF